MSRNKIKYQTPPRPSRTTQNGHLSTFFERVSRRFAERMGRITARFTLAQWLICWVLFLTVGVSTSMYTLLAQFLLTTETATGLTVVEGRGRPRSPPVSSDKLIVKDSLDPSVESVEGTTDTVRDSLEKMN